MLFNQIDFYIRTLLKFSRKGFEANENDNPEALYVQNLLEKFLSDEKFKSELKVLDIGSKNWCYVRGEWNFFTERTSQLSLKGIELDAYRLNSRFFSRLEIAKGYIKGLKNVKYIVGDLLKHNGEYDCIIWLLPFVFYNPHRVWGLPKKFFKPQQMLEYAFSLLNSGGVMLVVNQGEEEFEEQKRLCNLLNIDFEACGQFLSEPFKKSRFVSIIRKK